MRYRFQTAAVLAAALLLHAPIFSKEREAELAPLFFREDWKEIPAEIPVAQHHVRHPELIVRRHGPDGDSIKKSHHDNIPNDPWYIWSGSCEKGRWAISLQMKNKMADLSRSGTIRWRTKQSGCHILKVILELDDHRWIVGEPGFGETPDWQVFEVDLSLLRWRGLDIESIEAGDKIDNPDLNRVRSIGWTDLKIGEGTPGCTRVDWIEVYGYPVALDSSHERPGEH